MTGPGVDQLVLWVRRPQALLDLEKPIAARYPGTLLHSERSCLIIPLDQDAPLENVADFLTEVIPVEDADGARLLLAKSGREPSVSDLGQVVTLGQLVPRSQGGWLSDMLRDARTTTWFQPIVYARQTDRIFGQEALLRGIAPDGSVVAPLHLLEVAKANDLLGELELAAQRSAVQLAMHHGLQCDLFINVSPAQLHGGRLLRAVSDALKAAGIAAARVVFELTEADRVRDVSELLAQFRQYRMAGFRVALDDLGAGYASLNLLHQLKPDIVKLDMELIRGVHANAFKGMLTEKTIEAARSIRVLTVAEGVESAAELEWLRARGVDFVQGFLIARPHAPPHAQTPLL